VLSNTQSICQHSIRIFWDRCYDFENIFAENFGENIGVFAQTSASFCKNLIITLVFEKNANLFAEICQKSQKNVIITSTPDVFVYVLFIDEKT
jgi:hypothetical protein